LPPDEDPALRRWLMAAAFVTAAHGALAHGALLSQPTG
jgi:hypothetical protein